MQRCVWEVEGSEEGKRGASTNFKVALNANKLFIKTVYKVAIVMHKV